MDTEDSRAFLAPLVRRASRLLEARAWTVGAGAEGGDGDGGMMDLETESALRQLHQVYLYIQSLRCRGDDDVEADDEGEIVLGLSRKLHREFGVGLAVAWRASEAQLLATRVRTSAFQLDVQAAAEALRLCCMPEARDGPFTLDMVVPPNPDSPAYTVRGVGGGGGGWWWGGAWNGLEMPELINDLPPFFVRAHPNAGRGAAGGDRGGRAHAPTTQRPDADDGRHELQAPAAVLAAAPLGRRRVRVPDRVGAPRVQRPQEAGVSGSAAAGGWGGESGRVPLWRGGGRRADAVRAAGPGGALLDRGAGGGRRKKKKNSGLTDWGGSIDRWVLCNVVMMVKNICTSILIRFFNHEKKPSDVEH